MKRTARKTIQRKTVRDLLVEILTPDLLIHLKGGDGDDPPVGEIDDAEDIWL